MSDVTPLPPSASASEANSVMLVVFESPSQWTNSTPGCRAPVSGSTKRPRTTSLPTWMRTSTAWTPGNSAIGASASTVTALDGTNGNAEAARVDAALAGAVSARANVNAIPQVILFIDSLRRPHFTLRGPSIGGLAREQVDLFDGRRRRLPRLQVVQLGADRLQIVPHEAFYCGQFAARHSQEVRGVEGGDQRDAVRAFVPLTALLRDRKRGSQKRFRGRRAECEQNARSDDLDLLVEVRAAVRQSVRIGGAIA